LKDTIILEEDDPKKVKNVKKCKKIEINIIERKQIENNPFPPFTTDTLLKEANDKLKLGADEVMKIAQDLFEA
jgi:reverse gyrase